MPSYANPQSLNRYSYVNNSPLNYTDPSGHVACRTQEECLDMGTTPGGGFPDPQPDPDDDGEGEDQPDINRPPIMIPDHPCGGLINCSQQNPYNYVTSPFTSSDFCYFFAQDPIVCDSSSWQNLPNISLTSGAGYQPNAFGLGGGIIAGFFPAQGTGGIDAIYMAEANSVVVYGYNGNSLNTAGAGLVGGPYAIVGLNIQEPADYSGVSQAVNVTAAYGPYGATISYFWSGEEAFAPGAPQGFTLWYSPGLAASVSYSNVNYTPWIAIP